MNRFNKKARDNVKEKQKRRRVVGRDKLAARNAVIAARTGEPVVPKQQLERLAVSGKRTGKFKRKLVRKWQKANAAVAAMESGEVTMEDIVSYSNQSTKKTDKASEKTSTAQGTEGMEGQRGSSKAGGKVYGFRVKPSKKARLKLKQRTMAVEGSAGGADEMME